MNETKAVSMTFKKKLLIVLVALVSVVAIVVTSVLATVAYLTSSAAVSNVFTVGNVGIVMNEAKVNPDGTLYDGGVTRVDTNTYHLVPNKTYLKDPTITVNAGSENSYLFCLVRNDLVEIAKNTADCPSIATQLKNFGWAEYTTASTGKVYVYVGFADEAAKTGSLVPDNGVFATGTSVAKAVHAGNQYKLFEEFTIKEDANVSNYGAAKITLTAVAIQIAGFENNLDGAWEAVKAAHPYIHTGSN